jgi:hypothetical protein
LTVFLGLVENCFEPGGRGGLAPICLRVPLILCSPRSFHTTRQHDHARASGGYLNVVPWRRRPFPMAFPQHVEEWWHTTYPSKRDHNYEGGMRVADHLGQGWVLPGRPAPGQSPAEWLFVVLHPPGPRIARLVGWHGCTLHAHRVQGGAQSHRRLLRSLWVLTCCPGQRAAGPAKRERHAIAVEQNLPPSSSPSSRPLADPLPRACACAGAWTAGCPRSLCLLVPSRCNALAIFSHPSPCRIHLILQC